MYLRLLTLGDLVDASGRAILPNFWDGHTPSPNQDFVRPNYTRPPPSYWCLWQATLRTTIIQQTTGFHNLIPTGPLLCWPHGWYHHKSSNCLYHLTDDGYHVFPATHSFRRSNVKWAQFPRRYEARPPHNLCAVSVCPPITLTDSILLLGKPAALSPVVPLSQPVSPPTFRDFLLDQDHNLSWVFEAK